MSDDDVDLDQQPAQYDSVDGHDDSELPPKVGWKAVGSGKLPAPKLKI